MLHSWYRLRLETPDFNTIIHIILPYFSIPLLCDECLRERKDYWTGKNSVRQENWSRGCWRSHYYSGFWIILTIIIVVDFDFFLLLQ